MFYTVYKITNILNQKIYIGVHKTADLDDGYMGSGTLLRRAQEKYGLENFQKEILACFDNPESMFEMESQLVNEDFVARPDTYNMSKGGSGGNKIVGEHPLHSKPHLDSMNTLHHKRMKADSEYREKVSKKISSGLTGKSKRSSYGFAGKTHSTETCNKIAEAAKLRTGSKNGSFGTCWITNGSENKKIKKEDLQTWIEAGWRKGMIVK